MKLFTVCPYCMPAWLKSYVGRPAINHEIVPGTICQNCGMDLNLGGWSVLIGNETEFGGVKGIRIEFFGTQEETV